MLSPLDILAKGFHQNPTDKNMNILLEACKPQIHTVVAVVCKSSNVWQHPDRQDMFSELLVTAWELLKKYPKTPLPDDNDFNFKGYLNQKLYWVLAGKNGYLKRTSKKNAVYIFLTEANDIHNLEHSVNMFNQIEDKDFIQKLYAQCNERLRVVMDVLMSGLNIHQAAEALGVSFGTVYNRLKAIREIAESLLLPENLNKNKLECHLCKLWFTKEKFALARNTARGFAYWCRLCMSNFYLKRKLKGEHN